MVTTDTVVCYGGAKPGDLHLLADVRAESDAELVDYIERRRRWRLWYWLRDRVAWWMEMVRDRIH
jgi:hypothetical protein